MIKALKDIVKHNDERAWANFGGLAKIYLAVGKEKEGLEHASAGLRLKERCERWKRGRRRSLSEVNANEEVCQGEKKAKATLAGEQNLQAHIEDAVPGVRKRLHPKVEQTVFDHCACDQNQPLIAE